MEQLRSVPQQVLHCHDGTWRLMEYEELETPTPTQAALQRAEERIAALDAVLSVLRADATAAAEHAAFRLAEVEHRLKNAFATVQALAAQCAGDGSSSQVFGARLRSLAQVQDLLASTPRDGVPLAEVVSCCVKPYAEPHGRVSLDGPYVCLPARSVAAVGLAFHELATNAVKHGALSVPEGCVEIAWQLETFAENRAAAQVKIDWRERGGPPVAGPPERRGFGSRLLERGLAQVPGFAQLDFAPHGLDCHVRLSLTEAHSA